MNFFQNKKLYLCLILFEVLTSTLYYKGLITIHGFYGCGIVAISVLLYFGNAGRFPFIAKGQIGSKLAYFASGLIPLWGINLMANSFAYPFWYPTHHRFWVFLPIVILGFINIRLSTKTQA
jgi:hypothetical protein